MMEVRNWLFLGRDSVVQEVKKALGSKWAAPVVRGFDAIAMVLDSKLSFTT